MFSPDVVLERISKFDPNVTLFFAWDDATQDYLQIREDQIHVPAVSLFMSRTAEGTQWKDKVGHTMFLPGVQLSRSHQLARTPGKSSLSEHRKSV